jgi:hypothetical protein
MLAPETRELRALNWEGHAADLPEAPWVGDKTRVDVVRLA